MKRQLKKPIIPAITCTSILLASFALSHETIIAKLEPNTKNVPAKEKEATDPAITTITNEILTPVRQQEARWHKFSRSMPTRSNTYELVEVSSDSDEGARYFDIQVTTKNLLIVSKEKTAQKTQPTKLEPRTYLKLKYLTATNKVLIQQDHEWVERSKHKYFSLIPVKAPVNKK